MVLEKFEHIMLGYWIHIWFNARRRRETVFGDGYQGSFGIM